MACYHPLKGYRAKARNPSGKRSIVFNAKEGFHDLPVDLPCGQCIGCRLERSRQWAIRCVHEASLYDDNCFLTLTYSDEHLPSDGSVNVEHFQKFMKRLRFENPGRKVRFFHCGEYGDQFGRPHYHACLFNFDFVDKVHVENSPSGEKLYESERLNRLWPFGRSRIGAVTFESAAYVARYITKKLTGRLADAYEGRKPEYVTMSRRPGIGKAWYEKFKRDVFPSDFVVVRGVKMKPPKFYVSQFELEQPGDSARARARRKAGAEKHKENNSHDRLLVREVIQHERFKQLKRSYET